MRDARQINSDIAAFRVHIEGRGEGTGRVVRGGSFADPLDQARTTNRSHREATYGYPTVGFRCAQDK